MSLWHLTWSSRGRLRLLPDESGQRAAVRTLLRLGGDGLLLFSIVDDHVHAVVEADSGAQVARSLRMGLQPLTQAPVDPAHVRPVEDRGHLSWLVRYLLRQVDKHGLAEHPALWSGSCFQDLVGTRAVLPELAARLAGQLPRLRQRDLFELVGLDPAPLEPATADQLRAAGAARLVAASAFTLAVGPDLSGRDVPTVAARRLAASLSQLAGTPNSELAWALGCSDRTARRLLSQPAPDAHVLAARRRVALEDRVATRPRPPLMVEEPDTLDWSAGED